MQTTPRSNWLLLPLILGTFSFAENYGNQTRLLAGEPLPAPAAVPFEEPVPSNPLPAMMTCQHCYAPATCCVPASPAPGEGTILGDICGLRSCLAESGVTVSADVTHFGMGVVDGGRSREFDYVGHSDLLINADLSKFGLWEGLSLKIRGEGKFGQRIHRASGAILPPAILPVLPVVEGEEEYAVTNFLFTQLLSENFAVFFGKLDTFDGDANAFASGRGKTQFLNTGFVVNPVTFVTTPYSVLGAGFSVLGEGGVPLLTVSALNPTEQPGVIGLDDVYSEGVLLTGELRLPTQFFGLPGHQLVGGTWNSREYLGLGSDPRFLIPNSGVAPERIDGSWSLYYNFDQYLVVDSEDPLRGWGVFGRLGIADEDTNPIGHFASIGLGGSSCLPGRDSDTWGVGYYYLGLSDEISPIIPVTDERGIELFYRIAVTPYLEVTPDVQFLDGGIENVDSATVLGARVNTIF